MHTRGTREGALMLPLLIRSAKTPPFFRIRIHLMFLEVTDINADRHFF